MPEAGQTDPREWFLAEYERCSRRLYLVAYRILGNEGDALDAMQEAALRVFQRLDVIYGVESLSSYLATTARNVALDMVRQRSRRKVRTGEEAMEWLPDQTQEEVRPDEVSVLESAIERLPANYREALFLRYREDLNSKQIAERLGISHANARARVSRAHRALRREMKEPVCG